MNGSTQEARSLVADVINGLDAAPDVLNKCDVLVCPSFLYISTVRHAVQGFPDLACGAQDCSLHESGAYTGDVSASMIKDSGCRYVILGHSERRQYHGEKSALVKEKAAQALAADLVPIICIGETEQQREQAKEQEIVSKQLRESLPELQSFHDIVIAYEPVWAIGTGKTATVEDVRTMHAFIREQLKSLVPDAGSLRILYGGSMKPENAAELLATENVDGGLIGGASLKANDFIAIASAA